MRALRMTPGAAPARVRGMLLGQVGKMAIVGGLVGLSAAWEVPVIA
jgi:hypothetical protein